MRTKFGSVVYRADRKSYRAKYTYRGEIITKTFKDRLSAEAWLSGERSRVEASEAVYNSGVVQPNANGRKPP